MGSTLCHVSLDFQRHYLSRKGFLALAHYYTHIYHDTMSHGKRGGLMAALRSYSDNSLTQLEHNLGLVDIITITKPSHFIKY